MLSAFLALFAALATPSADQIVAKVQAYYAKTDRLAARFNQEYTNTTFGRSSKSEGRVYVAKPGKMRWDYYRPERKHFISDGTTLWVYEEAGKQAFRQSLKDQILPVAVTFLYGKGDLATEFKAALDPGKWGHGDDLVVKLTPRKPDAQYKHLWLVVDPGDFHVKESIIEEATGNVNHFSFFDIKKNDQAKGTSAKYFLFVPPPGVRVIKGEAAGKAGSE